MSERTRQAYCMTVVAAMAAWAGSSLAEMPEFPVFNLPQCDNIVVDGDTNDWQGQGLRVPGVWLHNQWRPATESPADFSPYFTACWSTQGVFVLCHVNDDRIFEADDLEQPIPAGDVLMAFLVNNSANSLLTVLISPGLDGVHTNARVNALVKWPGGVLARALTKVATKRTGGGYDIEALLGWLNTGVAEPWNQDVSLQLMATDVDPDERTVTWGLWFPAFGTTWDFSRAFHLALTTNASPPSLSLLAWRIAYQNRIISRDDAAVSMDRCLALWPEDATLAYESACFAFDYDEKLARELLAKSANISETGPDRFMKADSLFRFGALSDDTAKRNAKFDEALKLCRNSEGFQYKYLEARILFAIACFALEAGPGNAESLKKVQEARDFATGQGFKEFLPQLDGMTARYHMAKNDFAGAKDGFRAMLAASQWPEEKAYATRMLGQVEEKTAKQEPEERK